jgi:hypothetical protein
MFTIVPAGNVHAYIDQEIAGAPVRLEETSMTELENFFDDRYQLETSSPKHPRKRPIFVDDPAAVGSGRKVMLLHLQSSDPRSYAGSAALRTEISAKREYSHPGKERWYALSFYLDSFWPTYDNKTKFVLAQIHTSQKTVVLQPNIDVSALGDELSLTIRTNTRPVPPYVGAPIDDGYASKNNTTQIFVSLGKVQKSQWYCFVINAKWSNVPQAGHTKIWMNGKMVHEQYNSPNTYENLDPTLGNWPKIGIYAPAGFSPHLWSERAAWVKSYVDFIHVADPRGIGPNEMYDRTPCKGVKVAPSFPKT